MLLSGVLTSVTLSLSAIPLVVLVTDSSVLSEPLLMMTIGFGLLAGFAIAFVFLLPPSAIKPSNKLIEGRGVLYYTCCLFMWACIADLTIQARHLQLFNDHQNTQYFSHGEPYLETPLWTTAQFWNGVVNYCLYLAIIYKIDNGRDPRNFALYLCGGEVVILVGALTGSFSYLLQASVWIQVAFVLFPLWVMIKFLIKPRTDIKADRWVQSSFPVFFIFVLFFHSYIAIVLCALEKLKRYRTSESDCTIIGLIFKIGRCNRLWCFEFYCSVFRVSW